ncbi:MAG: trmB [Micavibrio sp.]|nr:trmB [Micavibrio sp.]
MKPETRKETEPRQLFGRRQTRSLSASKQSVFDEALARLQIPQELLNRGNLKAVDVFGKPFEKFWFEIGFGNGEHVKNEALAHPDTAFIGAEPFINGMAALLNSIRDQDDSNIRVYMDDAMAVVNALADDVLDGIYILNPDPWPKKRHWKRRIVQAEHVERFVRVLKPGGQLIMTTDIDDLAEWMCTHAANNPDLRMTANSPQDWQTPPPGWIPTRYESKGVAKGRRQTYLVFEKVGRLMA